MKSMSLILASLCLLLMIPSLTATPSYLFNICTNTTFPANSLYKANLNTVLNSLSTHVAKTHSGFYVTASGNGTKDAVYGFYLCRGDQNASSCADCVTTAATTDLPNTYCPSSKVAVIWYDECMARYSNESLFGKMEVDPRVLLMGDGITGNVTLFKDVVLKTMNDLVAPTANNQSGIKFTTKMVNFTKSDTLYAMELMRVIYMMFCTSFYTHLRAHLCSLCYYLPHFVYFRLLLCYCRNVKKRAEKEPNPSLSKRLGRRREEGDSGSKLGAHNEVWKTKIRSMEANCQ